MAKLGKRDKCPIHNSYFCCGREVKVINKKDLFQKKKIVAVEVLPDGREICSDGELTKRKHILIAKDPTCWLCGKEFDDYRDIDLEHKEPCGMNGCFRNDAMSNLGLAHRGCNSYKGSRRDIENVQAELRAQ